MNIELYKTHSACDISSTLASLTHLGTTRLTRIDKPTVPAFGLGQVQYCFLLIILILMTNYN